MFIQTDIVKFCGSHFQHENTFHYFDLVSGLKKTIKPVYSVLLPIPSNALPSKSVSSVLLFFCQRAFLNNKNEAMAGQIENSKHFKNV